MGCGNLGLCRYRHTTCNVYTIIQETVVQRFLILKKGETRVILEVIKFNNTTGTAVMHGYSQVKIDARFYFLNKQQGD